MGRFVVRRDNPSAIGGARYAGDLPPDCGHTVAPGVDSRVARLVGDGKQVLIFGAEAAELCQTLEAQDCRTVAGSMANLAENRDEGPFDAVVLAGILGRIGDTRAVLRAVKEQLRPDGALIVTLGGIRAVDGGLAIVNDGPLGTGSGVLFTEEGLIGLLEEAEYAIGHIEGIDAAAVPAGNPAVCNCLIVAHPLPIPGLDYLQRRMRVLAREGQEARREAGRLQREAEVSARRLEMLAGHEQRMAARIQELRARLLEAHAQSIRRDDEIRKTFGDAIYQRNALFIERDTLAGQRDSLLAQRGDWLEERRAFQDALQSAQGRLDLLRRGPLGLAYRFLRKLVPRRGASGGGGLNR